MNKKVLGALQFIAGISLLILQVYFIFIQDYESTADVIEIIVDAFVGLIFILMGSNNIKEG